MMPHTIRAARKDPSPCANTDRVQGSRAIGLLDSTCSKPGTDAVAPYSHKPLDPVPGPNTRAWQPGFDQETGKQVTLTAPRDQSVEARETASIPLKAQAKHRLPCTHPPAGEESAHSSPAPSGEFWPELVESFKQSCAGPLVVALSGGADSVFALELARRALGAQALLAVHIDHGLRAEESAADTQFCRALCAQRSIPFRLHRVELSKASSGLEARARKLRYRALCAAALGSGCRTIITGHHADDALETLLLRWLRGSDMSGLWSLHAKAWLQPGSELYAAAPKAPPMRILRPLLELRRQQIQDWLSLHQIEWREDSSNRDSNWARNRMRHGLLPAIEQLGGANTRETLLEFGRAIGTHEQRLEQQSLSIQWQLRAETNPIALEAPRGDLDPTSPELSSIPTPASLARSGAHLQRASLLKWSGPVLRRALGRLTSAGSGSFPTGGQLDQIQAELVASRNARFTLPKGWQLVLSDRQLLLLPPELAAINKVADAPNDEVRALGKLQLSTLNEEVCLPLGERAWLCARLLKNTADRPVPTGPNLVELEAFEPEVELLVRRAQPGDRFFPLGAPGSRKLTRFLADAGISSAQRQRLPLVFDGSELIWVAGVRPCHTRRLQGRAPFRLQLSLRIQPAGA